MDIYFYYKLERFLEAFSIVKSYKLNILKERLGKFGYLRKFSSNTYSPAASTILVYDNFILRVDLRLFIHLGNYLEYFR